MADSHLHSEAEKKQSKSERNENNGMMNVIQRLHSMMLKEEKQKKKSNWPQFVRLTDIRCFNQFKF